MKEEESKIERLERLILSASWEAYPEDLMSGPGSDLLSRAAKVTGDRPYAFGGQELFYEALSRLENRNLITVNRGTGGTFSARLTEEGARAVAPSAKASGRDLS